MATIKRSEEAAIIRREALGDLQPLRPAGSYTFDEIYRMGQVYHASGLFEDVKDAAQAVVKILRGQEMGIPPTTAMSAFDLIQKKLFIKPWAIAAKINACGYGSYQVTEQTEKRCTIVFSKKYPGQGWRQCPPVSYTIEEAQAHGLVNRSAHWKASPANMLYQRAMGRGGAMHFPELLAGMEMPPDDAPVPMDKGQQNVIDLYGDHQGIEHAQQRQRASTTYESHKGKTPAKADAARRSTIGVSIDAMLQEIGFTSEQADHYWLDAAATYPDLTPGALTILADRLKERIDAKQAVDAQIEEQEREPGSDDDGLAQENLWDAEEMGHE